MGTHVYPNVTSYHDSYFLSDCLKACGCLSMAACTYTVCSSFCAGSRSSSTSVLAELQKLLQAEATLEEKERQLADVSQQIQKIEKVAAKYV